MAERADRFDALRRKPGGRLSQPNGDIAVNVLWWIAFSVGSLLIIAASWTPVPYFYFVGLVLPLAVLLLYAYIGLRYTSSRDGHSQFSDSIYYLGFIFTLITLAVALVHLATQEEWVDVPLDELIGRFGLALSTTILGLAIRVATVNLSPTDVGLREDAEQGLLRSVENFRSQLQISADAFRGMTDTYLGELTKATEISSMAMQEHVKKTSRELDDAVEKVMVTMQESADAYDKRFRAKAAEMKFPDEIIAETLSRSIEKVTQSIDTMPAVISASLRSQRKIAEQSEKVAKTYVGLESSVEPLRSFSSSLGDVGAMLSRMMEKLESTTMAIEKSFNSSAGKIDTVSQELEKFGQRVSVFSERGSQATSRLSSALEESLAIASKHRQELEADLAASRKAVQLLHTELVAAANAVTRKLA